VPTFEYKVRDRSGKVLRGQMDAVNAKDLRQRLDEKDYFIVDYARKGSRNIITRLEEMSFFNRVNLADISVFSWQLYTMLDAGLTLITSLKVIREQTKSDQFKKVISGISQRVEQGVSFSEALREQPRVFNRLFVQMVNAGEVGGVLDEMMRRLAVYYENQANIRSRLKSAFTYPIILLTVSLLAILFLVVYVLPEFAVVFRDIGAVIPRPTQFLLTMSGLIQTHWYVFTVMFVCCMILLNRYIATTRGRLLFDRFKLSIPIVGTLIRKTLAARFTQTLAILVSGGIPILTSLDVVTDTIGNAAVEKALRDVAVEVGEGKPIAQPLAASNIFPDMVVNMVRVGEETGALDKMLDKIGEFYNREVNAAIDAFTKMVEPVLMVAMACIIGYISISIFLPMADLLVNIRI